MALSRDMLSQLSHFVRPLAARVANSLARAVVQVVDDSTKMQLLQIGVLAGEDIDDAERFQEYGFSSTPHPGAEAVVVFPNGDRAHPLVVAVDDRRHRPTASQAGEVVLYTDEGDEVRLGRGRVIVLNTGGEIRLGSDTAAEPVALKSDLDGLKALIQAWSPTPNDGGAALRTLLLAGFGGDGPWNPAGATKVKAE